jgi:predicted transcriptional regulator
MVFFFCVIEAQFMEKLMNYGFVNKKKKGSACKTGIYFVYYGDSL